MCNTQVCEKCKEIKNNLILDIPNVSNISHLNDNPYLIQTSTQQEQSVIRIHDHVCDENIRKTIDLLENDCKECPTCSANIFKIDGCDQMFCTSCHTAFDWKTGNIETGQIHNPHYFEWLKNNNQVPTQEHSIPYRRELHDQFIISLIRKLKNISIDIYDISFFIDEIQKTIHIKQVELQKYTTDLINNNRDLRIKFLKNEITQDEFKKNIYKREKRDEKNKEIYDILNMYITCFTDIIYNMYENTINLNTNIFKHEIQCLKDYSNNHLKKISNIYSCKEFIIT